MLSLWCNELVNRERDKLKEACRLMLDPHADKDGYLLLESYPYDPDVRREADYRRSVAKRELVKVEA